MASSTKKPTARTLDMSNVSEGSAFSTKRVPAGDYKARIVKVEDAEVKKGDNKGQPQWLFTIQLIDRPTSKYPYYCSFQENQLWKIRNIAVAAGINVPKKRIKLDPERLVGKMIAVTMEDDEYEGREKSTIGAIFPPSELADSDDDSDDDDDSEDEDEDSSDDDDSEDDDEGHTWSDIVNLDRKGLKNFNTENGLGVRVLKTMSDDELRDAIATAAKITKPAAIDDDDEDDEDEEEEAPVKSTKKKGKGRRPAVEDDELEELDIEEI